ncbi:MAG: hypothetical protein GYA55_13160 [SAR324 cluster bacterium]|uniref:Uncharacterized protein n=1 Tax=SAR324 cluster bacterium TaxID=2024889 RepID=A0A7X9FUH1_9DELT|nr:hypothetical protein [SAR324 cluster bacterium]
MLVDVRRIKRHIHLSEAILRPKSVIDGVQVAVAESGESGLVDVCGLRVL